jgi:hypothetical protein
MHVTTIKKKEDIQHEMRLCVLWVPELALLFLEQSSGKSD